ncbi:hypothetical protein NMY22_g10779 [Coprinellus aureogranulatus]|nr:hypothetical protein NMY22_g10779 [Coprinellus aureogranulatus]
MSALDNTPTTGGERAHNRSEGPIPSSQAEGRNAPRYRLKWPFAFPRVLPAIRGGVKHVAVQDATYLTGKAAARVARKKKRAKNRPAVPDALAPGMQVPPGGQPNAQAMQGQPVQGHAIVLPRRRRNLNRCLRYLIYISSASSLVSLAISITLVVLLLWGLRAYSPRIPLDGYSVLFPIKSLVGFLTYCSFHIFNVFTTISVIAMQGIRRAARRTMLQVFDMIVEYLEEIRQAEAARNDGL